MPAMCDDSKYYYKIVYENNNVKDKRPCYTITKNKEVDKCMNKNEDEHIVCFDKNEDKYNTVESIKKESVDESVGGIEDTYVGESDVGVDGSNYSYYIQREDYKVVNRPDVIYNKQITNNSLLKLGLHVDYADPLNMDELIPGTLHCYKLNNLSLYVRSSKCKVLKIIIPNDAIVNVGFRKINTNKIDVVEILDIKELPCWKDKEFCLSAISLNPYSIACIYDNFKDDPDFYFDYIINMHRHAYSCVENPKKDLTLYAIRCHPSVFYEVKDKNKTVCEVAVECDGLLLEYVPENIINYNICELAIRQNREAIQYVPKKIMNYELAYMAGSIKYLDKSMIDRKLCNRAVILDCRELEFVPAELLDIHLCKIAVQADGKMLKYCGKFMTEPNVYLAALKNDNTVIDLLPECLVKTMFVSGIGFVKTLKD
jgi:hypothetical protein